MELHSFDGDLIIEDIIDKNWRNKHATIAELAAYTETLLPGRVEGKDIDWNTLHSFMAHG